MWLSLAKEAPVRYARCLCSDHINITTSGKSCFLLFTLMHRLCNGKPTALQISDIIIVFEKRGVTGYDTLNADPNVLPEGTWALLDSEDFKTVPCGTFLMASRERRALIVQATSLTTLSFESWTVDDGRVLPYAMNAFSPSELILLGLVQPTVGSVPSYSYSANSKVLGLDGEALAEHSRRWGPSARICVELQRDPLMLPSLTSKARTAAAAFVGGPGPIDELQAMTSSDILFAVRPERHRLNGIVTVATDYFNQVLTETAAAADPRQRAHFYKMMTIRRGFEPSALYMLRSFFCAWFFNCQKSLEIRCFTRAAPGTRPRFSVLPTCENVHRITIFSSLKKADDLQTPFGLLPILKSFAFADAIICTNKYIISIKVTISSTIKVDRIGLKRVKNNLPSQFQANRKWIHVFVIDDEDKAIRLRSQQFKGLAEKDICVYSAVLDIQQVDLSMEDLRRAEEAKVSSHLVIGHFA